MNIAERRLPQDGRIKIQVSGRTIDVRVAIVPTMYGERAVMRILDKATSIVGLEAIGMGVVDQPAERRRPEAGGLHRREG